MMLISWIKNINKNSTKVLFEINLSKHKINNTLKKLKSYGVNLEKKEERKGKVLEGKTIVVTGALKKYTRERMKELIISFGGRPSSSVSKKTDFVLVGKEPGSKYEKARAFGVKIIGEVEFLKMIEV